MSVATETTARTPAARVIEMAGRGHRSIPVLVTLAIIWAVFYSQSSAYLSFRNITNLTLQIATTAILALGVVFVLLVGEIDLSSAVLSGVCAAVAAGLAVNSGLPLPLAIAVAIAAGMAITLIEALVITFGVPSLIVTLGGMVILQGLILVVLPPEFTVSVAGTSFAKIASTAIPAGTSYLLAAVGTLAFAAYGTFQYRERLSTGTRTSPVSVVVPAVLVAAVLFGGVFILTRQRGLPMPVLIVAVMLLIAWYFTTQTRYGIHLYAVGGDREAAQRAGIPVRRMVLYSFLILGACAAVAGMIDASRQLGVSVTSGGGPLMLNAIAAAVVGGTSLFGGRGSIWSAILGALVIGSISNGVQLLGLTTEVQYFATGAVLIIAVAVDVVLTRGSLLPTRGRRS
ncbi:ABC transporter permease [Actinoplanes sp. LDG1-06]|uniref:Xylose transport system permease protein XylH n=1 Tax=Paractinoplanes ovalisporus TaxID=2810368 RepID=A0ABS2AIM6_9ACTN|nr:ABC transporter permease [Actinoplanes ovalisporus]MBM2619694.1 ABC transporter permease [Actinoplanes ovalisporus]